MYRIQKSGPEDLPDIALCQRLCFPGSLSVKLGMAYLQKSLDWFLKGENRFLFHVRNQDQVIGYCGGFISRFPGDGSTSGMLRHARREALLGIVRNPGCLFRREIRKHFPRIARKVLLRFGNPPVADPGSEGNDPAGEPLRVGLVVIGIVEAYRGTGLFEVLLKEFESEAGRRKIYTLGLTVRNENRRAIAAYRRMGWEFSRQGETSSEMIKIIG